MKYVFCLAIILMSLLPVSFAHAQDACADLVLDAYALTKASCDATGDDEACYGNTALFANPVAGVTDFVFDAPGDIVTVGSFESLRLSEMNERTGEWGVSLMRIRANLGAATPENVELLIFGDVSLDNVGGAGTGYGPMQAFYFSSAPDDRLCNEAPNSGILIQTPKGVGTVTMLINEVIVDLGSTAYIQADPGDNMTINVVEGEGRLTAFGTTVTIPAGTRSVIPLASNGGASSPPGQPEPYSNADLITLPIALLSRPIVIAPAEEGGSTGGGQLPPAPVSETPTATATATSTSTPTATATFEPFIIEGAIIAHGGLQIYEEPTTQSERLYASLGGFNPTIIGRNEDSRWVDIYFCVGGRLLEGWTLSSRIVFEGNDLERLAVTDPEPPFVLPEIRCTPQMEMPIGQGQPQPQLEETEELGGSSITGTPGTPQAEGSHIQIYEVYDCVYIGSNQYEWYRAQAEADENGIQIGPQEYIGGPFTGAWQPGCPGTPTPTPTITPIHTEDPYSFNAYEVAEASGEHPSPANPSLAYGSALMGIAALGLMAAHAARRRRKRS